MTIYIFFKALEHEYIFSKYSWNLIKNILMLFWRVAWKYIKNCLRNCVIYIYKQKKKQKTEEIP